MTMLVSILKQAGLSKIMNSLIAMTACVIAGLVTAAATGKFNGTTAVAAVAVVFASAQGLYQTFWNIPGLSGAEAALNSATSFVKKPELGSLTNQPPEAIANSWSRMVDNAKVVVDWDNHVKEMEQKLEHLSSELKKAIQ